MPLSEHEQRLLEQMERALYAEDPKFATALEGAGMRTHTRRRTGWAIAGFVVGLVLLMTGVMLQAVWISVAGFLLMLTGAVLVVTGWRRAPAQSAGEAGGQARGGRAPRRRRAKMMTRIEDRWKRRRDEQGG
ncbi:DUF3040 domain-containing protein [Yinghuangia sp. ASG 101]|uniref:DUF3040 domain-containing protein n=1 Tax=Yinghuangia sp. ASG 101 TaxID=2896848 RepID=UPI001E29B1B3|nr:DUF3040 domain-containing protein [Yinghuangia sp. ASG 101]UGQ10048.1 DUF3040 domain-containing protein [Yinghuangia sp. ASG 101]